MNIPNRFSAWLTVNRDCNLNCLWCYSKATKNSETMSIDLAKRIISFFSELPIKFVVLIGGEPTIHAELFEILREIRRQKMMPAIVSNSVKFADRNFLLETIEAGAHAITTSLKAGTEDEYEKLTGRRALGKTIQGIRNITAERLRHKVSITIGKSVIDNFDSILEVLQDTQPEAYTLSFERPVIIDNKVFFDEGSNVHLMAKFIQEIYPKLVETGIRFTITLTIPHCLFPDDFLDLLEKRRQLAVGCQLIQKEGIIITPSGYLVPCNHFCHNPLALFGRDFTTAEEYYELRKRRDIFTFYNIMGNALDKRCSICPKWAKCGGGCRLYWLYRGANGVLPNPDKKEEPL